MTPMLLTLYGDEDFHGSVVDLGGDDFGPSVNIGYDEETELGVIPIMSIITAVGGVIGGIAKHASSEKTKRKKQKAEAEAAAQAAAAQQAAIIAQKARTKRNIILAAGGVVVVGTAAYLLMR